MEPVKWSGGLCHFPKPTGGPEPPTTSHDLRKHTPSWADSLVQRSANSLVKYSQDNDCHYVHQLHILATPRQDFFPLPLNVLGRIFLRLVRPSPLPAASQESSTRHERPALPG